MRLKLFRGVWCAVWREGGATKRQSLHTTDRTVAERRIVDADRDRGGSLNTINGIYNAYCDDKGPERALFAWKHLAPSFSALRPDQVTRATCRAYVDRRRKAKPAANDGTIHTELTYLRAALNWHDKATPAVVELPPKPPPAERYLTRGQYIKLLDVATTPHIRVFIVLALATAGRMAAILELTWDRVDFERGTIQLGTGERRRKGRATVPITDYARPVLVAAFAARTCDRVVEYGGEPVKKVRKGLARAADAAGMVWCTPHVFRHTAAVWMAEDGRPMAEIAQYLGHTDSRVTERVYARFSPEYLRHAAGSLEPLRPVRLGSQPIEIPGRSERI